MTENEAKLILNVRISRFDHAEDVNMALEIAKTALEEIRQYRAIGTAEECRKAVEKQKAKAPDIYGDGYDNEGNMVYDMYDCPNCGKSYETDYDDYKYCPECGQRFDLQGCFEGQPARGLEG